MDAAGIERLAGAIASAHAERRVLEVGECRRRFGGPADLDEAYRVQAAVTARRIRAGERRVGWKLGYTSQAMRAQMGVDAPNHGPLTDAMVLVSPAQLPAAVTQPRVEPEVALRLRDDVPAGAGVEEVLAAVDEALACLEVVDSVWAGYRFRLEDNTADGSSAAYVVLGGRIDGDLAAVPVEAWRNGDALGAATGAAASGHPAAGVAWLAAELARRGERLRAGDLVLTGGLLPAAPIAPGDVVAARFGGTVTVTLHRP